MILVTGATGNIGGELVLELRERGQPVRALVHGDRPASLHDVSVVEGDLDHPPSLGASLDGIRSVFLLPGYQDMEILHVPASG